MTPSAYQSASGPTALPVACSGAMYAGVPTALASVSCSESISKTSPKSSSTTRPSVVTRTFDGFTSRCTLPAAWSAESPRATCRNASRSRTSLKLPEVNVGAPTSDGGKVPSGGSSTSVSVVWLGRRSTAVGDSDTWLRREEPRIHVSRSTPSTSSIVKKTSSSTATSSPKGHQIAVVDVLQRAKLVLHARDGVAVVPQDGLERHALVPLDVERLVHHAHPALADTTQDLEARWEDELVERQEPNIECRTAPRPAATSQKMGPGRALHALVPAVSAPDLDDIDAGWEDEEDDVDSGWGEVADAAEPEEPEEPEPPGLTPEQRAERAAAIAARAAQRKERLRAKAAEKAERRKARAKAASAKQKKSARKSGSAGPGPRPSRPKPAAVVRSPQTEPVPELERTGAAAQAVMRAEERRPASRARRPWQPTVILVVILLVAAAAALWMWRR